MFEDLAVKSVIGGLIGEAYSRNWISFTAWPVQYLNYLEKSSSIFSLVTNAQLSRTSTHPTTDWLQKDESSTVCSAWNGTSWPDKELHKVTGLRMKALGWDTKVTKWLIWYKKRDLPENKGIPRLRSTRQETIGKHKETMGKQYERWW